MTERNTVSRTQQLLRFELECGRYVACCVLDCNVLCVALQCSALRIANNAANVRETESGSIHEAEALHLGGVSRSKRTSLCELCDVRPLHKMHSPRRASKRPDANSNSDCDSNSNIFYSVCVSCAFSGSSFELSTSGNQYESRWPIAAYMRLKAEWTMSRDSGSAVMAARSVRCAAQLSLPVSTALDSMSDPSRRNAR